MPIVQHASAVQSSLVLALVGLMGTLLAGCVSPGYAIPSELQDDAPITAAMVRLSVRGLGCPQCATNVDLQIGETENAWITG